MDLNYDDLQNHGLTDIKNTLDIIHNYTIFTKIFHFYVKEEG